MEARAFESIGEKVGGWPGSGGQEVQPTRHGMMTTPTPTPPPTQPRTRCSARRRCHRSEQRGDCGESALQASPASRRHSPGESRRGGGPERQPTRRRRGTPGRPPAHPLYRPTEDGRPSHGPPGGRLLPPLPPGPGCGRARATGECGAVSPCPIPPGPRSRKV